VKVPKSWKQVNFFLTIFVSDRGKTRKNICTLSDHVRKLCFKYSVHVKSSYRWISLRSVDNHNRNWKYLRSIGSIHRGSKKQHFLLSALCLFKYSYFLFKYSHCFSWFLSTFDNSLITFDNQGLRRVSEDVLQGMKDTLGGKWRVVLKRN
jgi:hypothetical protein